MKYEKYDDVKVSSDRLEYGFISYGPKGAIQKIIHFDFIEEVGVYNLAFGNLKPDGSIDDLSVNDNQDRNKILATVVYSVSLFCKEYPHAWIYFSGSTAHRTRLYRMAIAVNLDELSADFEILGLVKDMEGFVHIPFRKGIDYFGFLIRRKNV
ncbi:hypothetical protein HNQ91_003820 [Filimonas zeae]|uniref:Uncharacterized protein n=1 Tax=Filimonas zeae TaxID=1737353 RepID=A0A917J3H1_9BACT|nr:hypothetical protein [Filimonas zeae]MDR6340755.1 hypothetical protein [Filimonas zeae]GGH74217.1 hypothetical protein GCM10011379_36600 [Filimonas zeae]